MATTAYVVLALLLISSFGNIEANIQNEDGEIVNLSESNLDPETTELDVTTPLVTEDKGSDVLITDLETENNDAEVKEEVVVPAKAFCLGCPSEIDTESEKIKQLANFALSSINQAANSEKAQAIVRIVKATQQVVSGLKYELTVEVADSDCEKTSENLPDCQPVSNSPRQQCEVAIIEQAWRKRLEVLKATCQPVSLTPAKRNLAGGDNEADPSSPDVLEMAQFALETLDAFDENDKKRVLVQVLEANKQIVSGTLYNLKLQFVSSDCAEFSSDCEVSATLPKLVCDVQVLYQPWRGGSPQKLLQSECTPKSAIKTRSPLSEDFEESPFVGEVPSSFVIEDLPVLGKSNFAGGITPVADPETPDIQNYADFAMEAVNAQSNDAAHLALVKIRSAAVQIVAGKSISLQLEVSPTDCPKSSNTLNCSLVDQSKTRVCEVVIWDRPWLADKRVTSLSCSEEPRIEKRVNSQPIGINDPVEPLLVGGAPQPIEVKDPQKPPPVGGAPQPIGVSDPQEPILVGGGPQPVGVNGPVEPPLIGGGPQPVGASNPQEPPLIGGFSPADPNDPTVGEIAQFSTATIGQSINCEGSSVKLIKVENAATQVVAGTNYKLKLTVEACENRHSCEVVVWNQPWTQTREVSSVSCAPVPNTTAKVARQAGGYLKRNPQDPEIREIADFATASVGLNSQSTAQLLTVESAESQLVAGMNYRLSIILQTGTEKHRCRVVVFDQPWSATRELVRASCGKVPVASKQRSVGKRGLAGGYTTQDPTDPKIQEMASFSTAAIAQQINGGDAVTVDEVVSAATQVVSGMNYKLRLTVSANGAKSSCEVVVWDQPWTRTRKVTSLTCSPLSSSSRKRRQAGGWSTVSTSDSNIRKIADFSLKTLNERLNSNTLLQTVRILSAQQQVVAGMNYKIELEVAATTCLKSDPAESCSEDPSQSRQVCSVTVWDRPWLNKRQVTDISCREKTKKFQAKTKLRRNVVGNPNYRLKREAEKKKKLKHMNAFRSFMAKHNRVYKTWAEFEKRYKIYRENQAKIALLRRREQGTAVYGDTPFSDMSESEFKQLYTGLKPELRHPNAAVLRKAKIPEVELPEEFDWRNKSAVTPVKNQGQCGSCWAFSVTGNVEGQYAIRYGKLLSFSEQELVDCDKLDNGCNGGLPENAYKAIEQLGGLELEQDYPYDAKDEKCHLQPNKTQVQVTGGVEVSQNETEMALWLVQNGPISIGINANAMQFYRGGVSHPWKMLCRPGGIDHGVLIVGYGVSKYPAFNKTLPYWIIKNSWGTGWGEQGYYRIYRGDGSCGVNMMTSSATIA